ncbi:hypothetical protein EN871_12895 [bacterium M00.F.Ca.ET.228.01.1.1]|uniref:hypothetical protein n=1 Tax=Paraburkholderia phenoliruptrix TaxID=252970 RepID=UPI00109234AA|nr:hypothetical protein [Paraburkholderia phenoliruptrix]TGP43923.1 hypothetical protein EN871_12895 [bacterium M00.F.Ca.ET.228.01.1.1]TGS01586.1 hypothetical protein EN834_12890 [bacterium M00.F.Ca.ET.191.01.1.1]TGU08808.1 hypothetical protein EN798_06640 [bacterium M00.F.Ca.ET.155.01.1.1]MBW0449005.1 hypothetical protein [Paraburkholderia phenoliruptrix]MBW9097414.1 hypothetical protein [Paraburkholderia phenoliruptrix]
MRQIDISLFAASHDNGEKRTDLRDSGTARLPDRNWARQAILPPHFRTRLIAADTSRPQYAQTLD